MVHQNYPDLPKSLRFVLLTLEKRKTFELLPPLFKLSITQILFKLPSPLVFPSPQMGVCVASLKELGKEFPAPLLP